VRGWNWVPAFDRWDGGVSVKEIQEVTPLPTAKQGDHMKTILIMTALLAAAGCDKMGNQQTMNVNGSTGGSYSQNQSGTGNKQEMNIGGSGDKSQNQSGTGNEQRMNASGSGTASQNQSGSDNTQVMNAKGAGKVIQNQSGVNKEQTLNVYGDKDTVIIQNKNNK
jgi:hypothetical protein